MQSSTGLETLSFFLHVRAKGLARVDPDSHRPLNPSQDWAPAHKGSRQSVFPAFLPKGSRAAYAYGMYDHNCMHGGGWFKT
jgi:hypothetical protein